MPETPTWPLLAEQLPLLSSLPKEFRANVELRQIPRGAILFRRGDRPKVMFAVIAGETRLVRTARGGTEIILQRTRRGLFAEGSLDQPRYHCDGIAATDTTLAAIPRTVFRQALATEEFRDAWTAELLRELRRVRAQSERLSLRTAEERIVHFIETESDAGSLILTQSRKDWALELGLTHEALYRTLSRMEAEKILLLKWPKIEVLR